MTILTYGSHSIDVAKLPEASVVALLKRGLTHYLGNEQTSKLVAARKREGAFDGTTEEAYKADLVAKAVAALHEGTIGTQVRGPSVDPVEAAMERIARAEINAVLKAKGAKFVGKGDDRKVTFANGESFTMNDLIDRRLGNEEHSARIRKEAEKALKSAAKQAEAAKVAGPVSVDLIG